MENAKRGKNRGKDQAAKKIMGKRPTWEYSLRKRPAGKGQVTVKTLQQYVPPTQANYSGGKSYDTPIIIIYGEQKL